MALQTKPEDVKATVDYMEHLFELNNLSVKTRLLELQGMGRVPGFRVSECQMYGCRGQRCGLNLCVSPLLPEPECLCISEGQSKVKGSE